LINSILVLAAHPDDEVLGCGGTIARHAVNGDAVHVALMAKGLYSRGEPTAEDVAGLQKAAKRANALLGTASLKQFDFPDNRMDTVPLLDLTKTVETLIAEHRPQVVYTHWIGDVNIDHRRIHDAVVTACRSQPGHCVKELLFFEVPSSTEWRPPGVAEPFNPNWFVDISATLSRKLEALGIYEAELREFPHPRSLKAVNALAQWRGATAGLEAAEAFALGRKIISGA